MAADVRPTPAQVLHRMRSSTTSDRTRAKLCHPAREEHSTTATTPTIGIHFHVATIARRPHTPAQPTGWKHGPITRCSAPRLRPGRASRLRLPTSLGPSHFDYERPISSRTTTCTTPRNGIKTHQCNTLARYNPSRPLPEICLRASEATSIP